MRERRLSRVIQKDTEISNSIYASGFFLVIFGLWGFVELIALLFDFSLKSLLVTVFVSAIAIQSFTTLSSLRLLRRNLREDPAQYGSRPVPKPILYGVIFWFLPKL